MSTNALLKKTNQNQKYNKLIKQKYTQNNHNPLRKSFQNKENINPNQKNLTNRANLKPRPLKDANNSKDLSFNQTSHRETPITPNAPRAPKTPVKTPSKKILFLKSLNIDNFLTNINLKNKFTRREYHNYINQNIQREYSNDILETLLEEEKASENFLSKHKITERMRSRMTDWMIEVLSNYNCCEDSYFMAVGLMDKYFSKCTKELQPSELHLIGVTCMFIASKYQDIYPLRLNTLYEKVSHKKLTRDEIKNKEEEIAKCLEYEMTFPSIWEFINIFISEIFTGHFNNYKINENNQIVNDRQNLNESDGCDVMLSKLYNDKMIDLLRLVCIYLAKMNCHDYNLIKKKPSILAAASLFVGVKICEQINKEEYITDYFINSLSSISKYTEDDIIQCAQRILKNAQEFETLFPNLENLKRVHFKPILDFKGHN